MSITERGRWTNSTVDERGKRILLDGITERGQKVFGLSSGGTNVNISSVTATSNDSALIPTIVTTTNISITSEVAGSSNVSLIPTVSTQQQINISPTVANVIVNSIAPIISGSTNINVTVANYTSQALSPNVGSSTDVNIISVAANVGTTADIPSVVAIKNVNINTSIGNTTTTAISPTVGVIESIDIIVNTANANSQGINPELSISTSITSVFANVIANTINPIIQVDVNISANAGKVQTVASPPLLNVKVIVGTVELQGSMDLFIKLKGSMNLYINGLMGGVTMTIENQDLEMDAGETKYLGYTIPDIPSGSLTNATIKWIMYGKSVLIEKDTTNGITITDNVNGKIQVKLSSSDTNLYTGKYKYLIRVTDQDNNTSTTTKGDVTINSIPIGA